MTGAIEVCNRGGRGLPGVPGAPWGPGELVGPVIDCILGTAWPFIWPAWARVGHPAARRHLLFRLRTRLVGQVAVEAHPRLGLGAGADEWCDRPGDRRLARRGLRHPWSLLTSLACRHGQLLLRARGQIVGVASLCHWLPRGRCSRGREHQWLLLRARGSEDDLPVLQEVLGPSLHVGHLPTWHCNQLRLGLAGHLLLGSCHRLPVAGLHHRGLARLPRHGDLHTAGHPWGSQHQVDWGHLSLSRRDLQLALAGDHVLLLLLGLSWHRLPRL